MKLNRTQIINLIWGVVCALAALGAETSTIPFLPEKWRHYVLVAAGVAMWIKSHWNLFVNPNGTPAAQPYEPRPETEAEKKLAAVCNEGKK